jgi:hypothetical protein
MPEEKIKKKYVKPAAIRLSSSKQAYSACLSGGSPGGSGQMCEYGTVAAIHCKTGSTPGGQCKAGVTP